MVCCYGNYIEVLLMAWFWEYNELLEDNLEELDGLKLMIE